MERTEVDFVMMEMRHRADWAVDVRLILTVGERALVDAFAPFSVCVSLERRPIGLLVLTMVWW